MTGKLDSSSGTTESPWNRGSKAMWSLREKVGEVSYNYATSAVMDTNITTVVGSDGAVLTACQLGEGGSGGLLGGD